MQIKLELNEVQADELIEILENAKLEYGDAVEREAVLSSLISALIRVDDYLSIGRFPGTITFTEQEANVVFDVLAPTWDNKVAQVIIEQLEGQLH